MPEVKENSNAKAWAPPIFPVGGRISSDVSVVTCNFGKQTLEEDCFLRKVNSKGRSQRFECCHSLHISLFFDGTNNNDANDTKKNHPSNIAKLFHASIQDDEAKGRGYFSYYMPGVGTPFPEIGELDYSEEGLIYATGGEDRINWALVSLADTLHTALAKTPLSQDRRKNAVKNMSTLSLPLMSALGSSKRRAVMTELLMPLRPRVALAKPEVLGIKLYVYGFSRGAAEARAFVTWLSQLFETPAGAEQPALSLIGLPVSIEFLGVLDTVASVGIALLLRFLPGIWIGRMTANYCLMRTDYRSSSNAVGTSSLPSSSARVSRWIRSATRTANTHLIPMKWCTPVCTPMWVVATRKMTKAKPEAVRMSWCRRSFYMICMPKPLPLAHRYKCRKRRCRERCYLKEHGVS